MLYKTINGNIQLIYLEAPVPIVWVQSETVITLDLGKTTLTAQHNMVV